jgi:hypothetical protein
MVQTGCPVNQAAAQAELAGRIEINLLTHDSILQHKNERSCFLLVKFFVFKPTR